MNSFSEEEIYIVLDQYVLALRDIIDVKGAMTGAQYEQRIQAVLEELLADAYAGMNVWGAGATQFTDRVRGYLEENNISLKPGAENCVREINGPPDDRFSIGEDEKRRYRYNKNPEVRGERKNILLVRGLRLMNISAKTIEGIVIQLETEEQRWNLLDFMAENLNATEQDILWKMIQIRKANT